ncbi:MAG: PEPxxWA-CTERM sorting domain-containing protein [Caulobacteraceae bacterium]
MNKLVMAAMAAAAIFTASTASAASIVFNIDPTLSNVSVSKDSGLCLGNCNLSASLATPFTPMTIAQGDSQTFDFANFTISPRGIGGETYDVSATLAFLTPDTGTASTGGSAKYFTAFGVVSGGVLSWSDPVQTLTTSDGSTFTVSFEDLKGVQFGGHVQDDVTLTVDSVAAAVPEPASWGLMIAGLGLTGFALRRRRVASAAAATA